MAELYYEIDGVEYVIRVTSWDEYVPAKTSGDPFDCYPASGGTGTWDIYTTEGKPAFLEKDLSKAEIDAIEQRLFEYMTYEINERDEY